MKEELITNESGKKSALVPFLVGGLVGAGIMLLLAPKSGKELRKDIGDLTGRAKKGVQSTYDRSKQLIDQAKAVVTDAIDAGKTAYLEEKEKHRHAA